MNDFIPLENIRIATPCRASWDAMQGDEKSRFCLTCAKNVYNLSSMTRAEAENLIREKEGSLCVRFYQREDGTVLTDDCPVGIGAVRRPMKWTMATIAMLLAPLFTFGIALGGSQVKPTNYNSAQVIASLRRLPVVGAVVNWIDPPQIMGMLASALPPDDSAPQT